MVRLTSTLQVTYMTIQPFMLCRATATLQGLRCRVSYHGKVVCQEIAIGRRLIQGCVLSFPFPSHLSGRDGMGHYHLFST